MTDIYLQEYLLSMAEAAKIADLSPSTLKNQASKGRLRAEKVGRAWVTTRAWLQAYLDSRQHVKTSKYIGRTVTIRPPPIFRLKERVPGPIRI